MKEIAILLGAYISIGLLVCLILSFRKSKNPNAIKAIELFELDSSPLGMAFGFLLWPLWIFVQIMEQDLSKPLVDQTSPRPNQNQKHLIGRIGIAATPMLPCGRITLDGKEYEAVSNGPKLERGDPVEILSTSMGSLIVSKHHP